MCIYIYIYILHMYIYIYIYIYIGVWKERASVLGVGHCTGGVRLSIQAIISSPNVAEHGLRKGTNGVSTNGVTANPMFIDRDPF